jgi:hypothetical protein
MDQNPVWVIKAATVVFLWCWLFLSILGLIKIIKDKEEK